MKSYELVMTLDTEAEVTECAFGVCNMTAFVAQLPIVKEAEIFKTSEPYFPEKIVKYYPKLSKHFDTTLLTHSQIGILRDKKRLIEDGKYDSAIALLTICGHYLDSNGSCIVITCVCMEQFSPRAFVKHSSICNDMIYFLKNGKKMFEKAKSGPVIIRDYLKFKNVKIGKIMLDIHCFYRDCILRFHNGQNKEETLHECISKQRALLQVSIDKLIAQYLLFGNNNNNNNDNNDSIEIAKFERRIANEIKIMFGNNELFKYLAKARVATKQYSLMSEEAKKIIDNNKREYATNAELRLLRNEMLVKEHEQVEASRMAKEAEREELRKRWLAGYKDRKGESEKQNESEKEDASTKIKQNESTANNHDEMDNECKNNDNDNDDNNSYRLDNGNDTTLTRWQRRLLRQRQKIDYENGFDSKFEEKPDKYKREASFDGKYDIYRCNETIDFQNANGEWKRIKNSTTLVATANVPELPHPFKVVVQIRNTSTLDVDADDTKSNQNDNPPNDTEMQ